MRLCVCVSVSLSARISLEPYARYLPNPPPVYVAYSRGSVLLRRRCDTLCTSGFVDDIMFFFYNGPYSGIFRYEGPISLKFTYLPQCETEFNFVLLKSILLTDCEITRKLK